MTGLFDTGAATARALAEKGIAESHEHAEAANVDWTARAVKMVEEYARTNVEFLAEDVREWAYRSGLPEAPVEGAWGQVMRSAAARGICHRAGKREARSPGSHGKLMTLWRKGPQMLAQQPTSQDAHNMADSLERFSLQMRKEGRIIFAENLLEAAGMMRRLAQC